MSREIWTEIVPIQGKFLFEYSFLLINMYQLQSGIELVLQSSRARSINSGRPQAYSFVLVSLQLWPPEPGSERILAQRILLFSLLAETTNLFFHFCNCAEPVWLLGSVRQILLYTLRNE